MPREPHTRVHERLEEFEAVLELVRRSIAEQGPTRELREAEAALVAQQSILQAQLESGIGLR